MSDAGDAAATASSEPGSLRLIATLFVAGALSGLAIAAVYEFTKPIIEANNAEALRRAIYKVVPGASRMQRLALRDGRLVALPGAQAAAEPVVYGAYDDGGAFVGYAIEGDGSGFQDTIRLLYGFDPARRIVTGLEILESRETPGLGDRIMKDPDFAANFGDLAVEPAIELVKSGRHAPNEVDAITGATISSKAVVKIVKSANEQWLPLLPASGEEPALADAPASAAGANTAGAPSANASQDDAKGADED